MSVKKQILSLRKLFLYEDIPEELLDESDVDRYFCHNIFDTSQSQHQLVRVSRGSNKESFAIKLFQFCDLKTQQRYILQEELNISKRKLTCLVDIFSKLLIKLASAYRFPYRRPKTRLDLQSQKTISLLITTTISLNMQIDKVVYYSDLETTILASFPSKD